MREQIGTSEERERVDARLLLTLFDRLPAMIAYWDQDCRNVVANAAYVEWFGFDPESMPGIHISEVLGSEVYAKNLPYIRAALAGEEQLFDRTLVDQSGRTRHTQASYVPDVVDGKVRGFFVLVTDVTPRVEAQRAADEAQSLARLGSWELDPATGEVTWSKGLYDIIGLGASDQSPTLATLADHLHPTDRDRVLSHIDHVSRTDEPYTTDYRILRTDGQEREVVSSGRPTLDPSGKVLRISGTLQDVTEANAAARELARINAELRRANELNADVIAMLGHDIRTPISAVRGFLEILDEDWDSHAESDRHQIVKRARVATTRLVRMVDRILALAAIDSGSIQPFLESIDLPTALAEIVEESGIPTRPDIVIAPGTATTCRFDQVHLEQILGNLLANAHRYGAEPIRLFVSGRSNSLKIAVTDTGPGVPPSARESLFSRFARTGQNQAFARGTGFGLYMASQLALANGGRLTYETEYEGNAHAFVLTIPVR